MSISVNPKTQPNAVQNTKHLLFIVLYFLQIVFSVLSSALLDNFSNSKNWSIELYCNRKITNSLYFLYTVSYKSEYTPHISATNKKNLLKGQYYTNETWIYFRVVNVQLV